MCPNTEWPTETQNRTRSEQLRVQGFARGTNLTVLCLEQGTFCLLVILNLQ